MHKETCKTTKFIDFKIQKYSLSVTIQHHSDTHSVSELGMTWLLSHGKYKSVLGMTFLWTSLCITSCSLPSMLFTCISTCVAQKTYYVSWSRHLTAIDLNLLFRTTLAKPLGSTFYLCWQGWTKHWEKSTTPKVRCRNDASNETCSSRSWKMRESVSVLGNVTWTKSGKSTRRRKSDALPRRRILRSSKTS